MTFFLQFSLEQEKQEIWTTTLKVIFDLLLYYGFEFFDISKNSNNSNLSNKTNKLVKLFNQMDDEDITTYRQSSNDQVENPDIMKILTKLLDNVVSTISYHILFIIYLVLYYLLKFHYSSYNEIQCFLNIITESRFENYCNRGILQIINKSSYKQFHFVSSYNNYVL